jgi:hypothetical protein
MSKPEFSRGKSKTFQPPPHGVGAACRPTPPGGPTLLARQVGPQCGEHPSHCLHGQGLGLPCYGPPWPSNTGQSYLPLLRPRGASGKLRQVQDSEPAGLGLQRAQLRVRSTGVSWHLFADSADQAASSWPLACACSR